MRSFPPATPWEATNHPVVCYVRTLVDAVADIVEVALLHTVGVLLLGCRGVAVVVAAVTVVRVVFLLLLLLFWVLWLSLLL